MLTCPHGLPYECACAECFKEAMQREQERQNPPATTRSTQDSRLERLFLCPSFAILSMLPKASIRSVLRARRIGRQFAKRILRSFRRALSAAAKSSCRFTIAGLSISIPSWSLKNRI